MELQVFSQSAYKEESLTSDWIPSAKVKSYVYVLSFLNSCHYLKVLPNTALKCWGWVNVHYFPG